MSYRKPIAMLAVFSIDSATAQSALSLRSPISPLPSIVANDLMTTDGSVRNFQNGSKTAEWIYKSFSPPGGNIFDGLRGVVDIEPGSTVEQAAGVAGYAYAGIATAGYPNGHNAVGISGISVIGADNGAAWGSDSVCADAPSIAPTTGWGRTCIVMESDFIANTASEGTGLLVVLQGNGIPKLANGIYGITSNSVALWNNFIATADGAAANAALFGAASARGANVDSQLLGLRYHNLSAVSETLILKASGRNGALDIANSESTGSIQIKPSDSGNGYVIVAGSDSNINLNLNPKGRGAVVVNGPEILTDALHMTSAAAGTLLTVGGINSPTETSAPPQILMDQTYSSASGSNPKLVLYSQPAFYHGLGVSVGGMDYIVPQSVAHRFYSGGVLNGYLTDGGVWLAKQLNTGAGAPRPSSCGTRPSVDAGSSSNSGKFTLGTGTTVCTLTFAMAFKTNAYCTITMTAAPATLANVPFISSQSRTGFTMSGGSAMGTYLYNCGGN